MGEESESSPLDPLIVAVVVVVWIGVPTLLLGAVWAFALGVGTNALGIALPPIGAELLASVGAPPRTMGVPTVYPVFGGLATTLVWYARTGGGSSGGDPGGRERSERRWDL